MTSLHIVSIVPIEFYTKHNAKKARRAFQRRISVASAPERLTKIANSLTDSDFEIFSLPSLASSIQTFVGFEGSSCAFITIYSLEDWSFDPAGVDIALRIRRERNRLVRSRDKKNELAPHIERMSGASHAKYGRIWPSYAFTFFCIPTDQPLSPEEVLLAKLMAEPTLIGNDELQHESARTAFERLEPEALSHVTDCDISILSETYITWSTICSVIRTGDEYDWRETADLLIALEVRLQTVWNRCYAMSRLAEEIFEEVRDFKDTDELYIAFARTIDDARSVLSSMISGRADKIFKALIETSQISAEIQRLQGKLDVVSRFIERKALRQSRGYRRAVEFLLLILASLTLIEALIGFPILDINNSIRPIIAGSIFFIVLIIAGVLIWLRPSD